MHPKVKQNKEFTHHLHQQGDVQPPPGKQGSIMPNGFLGKQTP